MPSLQNKVTENIFLDNLLINFPFWFPLTYLFLVFNFPSYSNYIFFASLFLFAETHFASTWLFFFDRQNWSWLKVNFYKLVYLPLYCLVLTIIVWHFSPTLIIIVHYLASGWHVTKQSTGILKMYKVNPRFYEYIVYFISFTCLSIGLNKPGLLASNLDKSGINTLIMIFSIIYFLILILNISGILNRSLSNLMPLFTGVFIYIPILFFDNLSIATALGVGMHWCQYITIIWSTYLRKNLKLEKDNKKLKFSNIKKLSFVLVYALIMSSLAFFGMPKQVNEFTQYSFLYLIPLLFQLYHFYVDGYIWKFSDPHIQKSILPYIFKKP